MPGAGPRERLRAIVAGNFDDSQISSAAMKAWLAFWASSMHQPMLYRLQQVSSRRLLSNLVSEFRRELPRQQAQEAGYGIDAAQAGTHLVVLEDAKLDGSTLSGTSVSLGATGNAVVWAENATGDLRCSALLAPSGSGQGGLRKLGPVDCADAAAFSALAWTALPLSDAPAAPVTITWRAAACTPFGIAAGTGADEKVLLTLTADNSNGVQLKTSQCLVNVSASPP